MSDAERLDYERTIENLRFDKARWGKVAEILATRLSIAQRGDSNAVEDILWAAYNEAYHND